LFSKTVLLQVHVSVHARSFIYNYLLSFCAVVCNYKVEPLITSLI